MGRPTPEKVDIAERGGDGKTSQRRIYMQLQAFTGCREIGPVIAALQRTGLPSVLYEDINDPSGLAVVFATETPADLLDRVRPVLSGESFNTLTPRPDLTMLGRSYSLGYEPDLDETLINRPLRHLLEPGWPWAIWYPLRRSGAFQRLSAEEQREVLMEHGRIGYAYGSADLAHDIRLACHGLDVSDNDFVIGLLGRDLTPLSKIVERMRKTKQTSTYLERLGPFFVGRKAWQSAPGSMTA